MRLGIAIFPADYAIRPDELARAVERLTGGAVVGGRAEGSDLVGGHDPKLAD